MSRTVSRSWPTAAANSRKNWPGSTSIFSRTLKKTTWCSNPVRRWSASSSGGRRARGAALWRLGEGHPRSRNGDVRGYGSGPLRGDAGRVCRVRQGEQGRAGHGELSRHGDDVEKAQNYCRWLSERTGRAYRLPDAKEAEKLYDDRDGGGENTLDYWAGYAPNPEDAARLRKKVKELGGPAPLLRPVGRFKGEGQKQAVFDLGGNAAEWVRTVDGKGRAAGGCAALPSDARTARRNPTAAYIGFRVVRAS